MDRKRKWMLGTAVATASVAAGFLFLPRGAVNRASAPFKDAKKERSVFSKFNPEKEEERPPVPHEVGISDVQIMNANPDLGTGYRKDNPRPPVEDNENEAPPEGTAPVGEFKLKQEKGALAEWSGIPRTPVGTAVTPDIKIARGRCDAPAGPDNDNPIELRLRSCAMACGKCRIARYALHSDRFDAAVSEIEPSGCADDTPGRGAMTARHAFSVPTTGRWRITVNGMMAGPQPYFRGSLSIAGKRVGFRRNAGPWQTAKDYSAVQVLTAKKEYEIFVECRASQAVPKASCKTALRNLRFVKLEADALCLSDPEPLP